MNEAVWRYICGIVLCALISVAYSATRKRGAAAIAKDCTFCFGCMLAVIAAVALVVHALCELK
ncbi:hypothetical protein HQ560_10440 [bacterium]|nr:hypothetical protein [bacterium]